MCTAFLESAPIFIHMDFVGQRHPAFVVCLPCNRFIHEALTMACSRFYSYANTDCNAPMVLAVNPLSTGQTAAAFQETAKTAKINRPTSPSSSSSSSSEPSTTITGTGSGPTSTAGGKGGGAKTTGINSLLAFGAFLLALI